jgi:hypothetical protein
VNSDHALFVNKRKAALQQDNHHQTNLTTQQQPTTNLNSIQSTTPIPTFNMIASLTLLALSAGALASPVIQERQMAIPENWTWHVSGWEAGNTRTGAYYNFNVTMPSVEGKILGAKAYCHGDENGWYMKGNTYANCQILEGVNNGVSAKLSERTSDNGEAPKEILISFTLAGYEDR